MLPILQFRRLLASAPQSFACEIFTDLAGLTIRNFNDESDLAAWLELRRIAFAKSRVGLPEWSKADFNREFLQKPWWRPERMWLAELPPLSCVSPSTDHSPLALAKPAAGKTRLIGAVCWADRVTPTATIPAVHWLMVAPNYRRLGLGQLLLRHLELAVWNAGLREIRLETHQSWQAAVALYRACGYELLSVN